MSLVDVILSQKEEVEREVEREVNRLAAEGWYQRGPIWTGTWWEGDLCYSAARTVMANDSDGVKDA